MIIQIDQLIRSKRRTISLQIKGDGSFVVRAPLRVDISKINKFVDEKSKWIITKQLQIKNRLKLRQETLEKHGWQGSSGILLLGEKCFPEELFLGDFSAEKTAILVKNKTKLISYYKREALKYIVPQLNDYVDKMGLRYNKIKMTSARKRWGSCSARGNINFSWRLILAPRKIVDYVIVHEAAHLKHRNHSVRFWNLVESILPDYKKHHRWLRESGYLLDL